VWHILWRYFTGLHLDGKVRRTNRSGGSVLPRYSNYFWNRYSRRRKALWRNLFFWGIVLTMFGFSADRKLTIFALLAFTPFAGFVILRQLSSIFTQIVNYSDSDGVTEKYRVIRPQIRRRITSLKPAKFRISLPDGGPVPPEIQRAIMADNAEDGGEPITSMRQLQIMSDPGTDATSGKKSGRPRTIRRANEKNRRAS
jgi:hypothetical protein